MLSDGRYTVVYPSGDYRTMEVKTMKRGNLTGRTLFKIKEGHRFSAIGFLGRDNKVAFWRRFQQSNSQERLVRISRAVERIVADPLQAGLAYAMKERRCCRCGRELTVPASVQSWSGS